MNVLGGRRDCVLICSPFNIILGKTELAKQVAKYLHKDVKVFTVTYFTHLTNIILVD